MKKFLSGLLTGIILTSVPAAFALNAPQFNDIGSTWYTDAVNRMTSIGIIKGYEDGTFKPNKDITRAEVAVMMDRLTQYIDQNYVKTDTKVSTQTNCTQATVADWKIFSNKTFKYEIKHPACFIASEEAENGNAHFEYKKESGTAYLDDGDIVAFIEARPNVTENLSEWFNKNAELTMEKQKEIVDFMAKESNNSPNSIKLSDITTRYESTKVAGLDAIVQYTKFLKPAYIEGGAKTNKQYYFKKNNTLYIITASTPTASETEARIATFDKMMETFKFTN